MLLGTINQEGGIMGSTWNRKKRHKALWEGMEKQSENPDFKLMLCLTMHFFSFWEEFEKNEEQAILNLSCSKCQDYINKVCPGMDLKGPEVIDCMWEQAACSEFEFF